MKIGAPQIVHRDGQIVCRARVESGDGDRTLWYSVGESHGDLLSASSDAFAVALLIPAMARGEDMHLDGAISERLYYNLSRPLQSVLRLVIPALRPVAVHPGDLSGVAPARAAGVATGFSGGIDSYCVLADHHYSPAPEHFRVTHLLFNNVGSHATGERLFRKRYRRLLPVVEQLGLPLVLVNSNLDGFYGDPLGFQQTHTPRNASVALLLQGGIGRFLYASTYGYLDASVGATKDMAYSDTVTLPLLSTETLDAFSVGSEYSRVEKTLRVAEVADSHATLDVCANPHSTGRQTNCSTCWKCLRTLATLEIAGRLELYRDSFDLAAYRSRRMEYLASLPESRDPLLREIVEFASERGFPLPTSSRIVRAWRRHSMAGLVKRALLRLGRLAKLSR